MEVRAYETSKSYVFKKNIVKKKLTAYTKQVIFVLSAAN